MLGARAFAELRLIIRSPGPVLLALCFGLYSVQYHALTGLLPTLLVERLGLSIAQAGTISAGTIVANGLGAFSAGFLLRKGIALWVVISIGLALWAQPPSESSINPCLRPRLRHSRRQASA